MAWGPEGWDTKLACTQGADGRDEEEEEEEEEEEADQRAVNGIFCTHVLLALRVSKNQKDCGCKGADSPRGNRQGAQESMNFGVCNGGKDARAPSCRNGNSMVGCAVNLVLKFMMRIQGQSFERLIRLMLNSHAKADACACSCCLQKCVLHTYHALQLNSTLYVYFRVARALFTIRFWSSTLTTKPGYTW
eukprot:533299-Pelagomonas_calceolata.AAC.1